ncbi:MAG: nucleotidyltransferase [Nitrospira sp.]|nr:nucleotidyltransferase [Nitrospira sp.]
MAEEPLLVQALSTLIRDFNRRGVQYALAGGWAYSALVEPRATTDIDVLLLLEQPSRDRLRSLFASLFDSTIIYPTAMVFHGISIWRCVGILKSQEVVIDLLLADSEYLQTALARRRRILLDDLSVPILTVEDLILLKTLAGRLQDQADLEKIKLRQDELHVDWAYVDKWKAKLSLPA